MICDNITVKDGVLYFAGKALRTSAEMTCNFQWNSVTGRI